MTGDSGSAECDHNQITFLGEDTGRNRYFSCKKCGAVLVHDGAKLWSVKSKD